MALELNKLTHDVDALGANAAKRLADLNQRLPAARRRLDGIGVADDWLRQRARNVATGKFWPGAIPTDEAVNEAFTLPPRVARMNVLAADGSQIYPDRHGVALYYLINIGSIAFRHGLPDAPTIDSHPNVFYEDADLYEEDGGQIPSVMIDAKRDVAELGELARLAETEVASAPTVALLDNGLLLYVATQTHSQENSDKVIEDYLAHFESLRETGAALAGVVDRPRAANVVRLLHLAGFPPDETVDPDRLRALGPLQHITDRMLFNSLKPSERSALFITTSSPNLERYSPRHTIYFFYINAGRVGKDALLRVEVPRWIAEDREKLNLTHAAICEQCRVSDGFPYVLMRAHELAVVAAADRRAIDDMVASSLIRNDVPASRSQKLLGKQWTSSRKGRFP